MENESKNINQNYFLGVWISYFAFILFYAFSQSDFMTGFYSFLNGTAFSLFIFLSQKFQKRWIMYPLFILNLMLVLDYFYRLLTTNEFYYIAGISVIIPNIFIMLLLFINFYIKKDNAFFSKLFILNYVLALAAGLLIGNIAFSMLNSMIASNGILTLMNPFVHLNILCQTVFTIDFWMYACVGISNWVVGYMLSEEESEGKNNFYQEETEDNESDLIEEEEYEETNENESDLIEEEQEHNKMQTEIDEDDLMLGGPVTYSKEHREKMREGIETFNKMLAKMGITREQYMEMTEEEFIQAAKKSGIVKDN